MRARRPPGPFLIAAAILAATIAAATPNGVPLRVAGLPGPSYDGGRFLAVAGFNAAWIDAGDPEDASAIGRQASIARHAGLRVVLAVDPVRFGGGAFAFSDPSSCRRLARAARRLARKAKASDVVLTFGPDTTAPTDFRDLARWGTNAAAAHVALARRVREKLPSAVRLWIRPATASDAEMGVGAYGRTLLATLALLPREIGVVWSGPEPRSSAITSSQARAARRRLGDRPLLLADGFAANGAPRDDVLAVSLAPLRDRARDLDACLDGFAVVVGLPAEGSRLSLLTAAEWLHDPRAYDSEIAWHLAIDSLAGGDGDAREALRIQALEWGAAPGDRNEPSWPASSPEAAAAALDDPAAVASFTWVVSRYPKRLGALARLSDATFRETLRKVMSRRLAVARTVPLVVAFRERARLGRADASQYLDLIEERRRDPDLPPDARRVLDLFLRAAEVPVRP